jgi:hypothetical protein
LAAGYSQRMIKIDVLRGQHDAALDMAQRFIELVDDHQAGAPAYPILMQFNRLFGILRVHFAHEDVELYPHLIASADPQVARTARLYVDEMGDFATNLECFAQHWSCSASIAGNFEEFSEAARALMLELAVRIEREDQHLYPLAEASIVHRQRNAA